MSSEKMNYEANSLREFLRSDMASNLDSKTKMSLKLGIRKQTIRKIFQFESLYLQNFMK